MMEIDVDSDTAFLIAIESFIYKCSSAILPKEVDREQLVQNIEMLYHDHNKRFFWIDKGIGLNEQDFE